MVRVVNNRKRRYERFERKDEAEKMNQAVPQKQCVACRKQRPVIITRMMLVVENSDNG